MFWITLAAYEAVWFACVVGAGHGWAWPGVLAAVLFVAWRLGVSRQRGTELRLTFTALVIGLLFDAALAGSGLLVYAAAWPASMVPLWMLALWGAFGMTLLPLFGYLHTRPWLAVVLGAIGGPLSYLAAARGWHAATFSPPTWQVLAWLALGWGLSLPLLTTLARRWSRPAAALANAP